MSVKRATLTPPPAALHHERVRTAYGAYSDAHHAALRLIDTLNGLGEDNHAEGLARDVYQLARRAERHMRRMAAAERRAANNNAREDAA